MERVRGKPPRSVWRADLLFASSLVWLAACSEPTSLRVIVDTDFGDDVDDTWALAFLLGLPEVDLRLVVTSSHGVLVRTTILAKFLSLVGAAPPIGVGLERRGPGDSDRVVLADWADASDLAAYNGTVHLDGVRAIVDEIKIGAQHGEETVVVEIGPRTNLAAALQLEPSIQQHVRVVSMGGSIFGGYNGSNAPSAEWNILADAAAARQVQEAAWPVLTAPLDAARRGQLSGEAMQRLAASSSRLPSVVLSQSRFWLPLCPYKEALDGPVCHGDFVRCSSVLYDAVAAVLVLQRSASLLRSEELPVKIHTDGTTSIEAGASLKDWVVDWLDSEGWQELVASTLSPMPAGREILVWE